MSQPPRPPHTICLRSTDASEIEPGVFRWTLTSENRRALVDRVFLASIELPLSQLSIETAWNRVYLCERLRLAPGRRTVTVTEHAARRAPVVVDCVLPLHLNAITSVIHRNGRTLISTEHPHGLSDAMFDWARDQEDSVMAICTSEGAVNLSAAWRAGDFRADDDSTFSLSGNVLALHDEGAYVWFASPATPSALASMLTAKLEETELGRRVSISFDPTACAFAVRTAAYPEGADALRLRVEGDELAVLTGLSRVSKEFVRRPRSVASTPSRPFVLDDTAGEGDVAPLIVSASAAAMFGYAALRPGSYVPCQRIYSASPPLKLALEWELQFARFVFPRREVDYGLVYTDPLGINRILVLHPGSYTVESLVNVLRTGMNERAEGHTFDVAFEQRRFRIACRTTDGSMGLAFALHFTHPQSIDAARLGFEDAVLEGADNYESSTAVHVPATPFGPLENSYAIGEVPGQRNLSLRPVSTPSVVCIVEEYVGGVMTLRCVSAADGSPVAHAYRAATVAFLSTPGGGVNGEGGRRYEGIAKNIHALCVIEEGAESGRATTLKVRVRGAWAADAADKVVQLSRHVVPSSFCFSAGLPQSVGGERLGFDARTIQWGIDGSVATRTLKLPPFVGSRAFNLDHVDFILLRIREGKNSTNITYETNGRSYSVFGKVVINPIFRNERHLPVESGVTGMGRYETLTIELLNPDMTHYRSNGATWSLSLSMTT